MSSHELGFFGALKEPAKPSYVAKENKDLKQAFQHRFYTRPRVQKWCDNEVELNTAPFETTVTTFNLDGTSEDIKARGPNKRMAFCSYHQFVVDREDQPPATDEAFDGKLVRVGEAWPVQDPEQCCAKVDYLAKVRSHAETWKQSYLYSKITRYVEQFALSMVDVKSIVCFGLGRLMLNKDQWPNHVACSYLQHCAVLRIRHLIAKAQNKREEDIPIYAQDPAYCANCKTILTDLGFTIVPGYTGFLKVDGNAFVVAIRPALPVHQIVADLTRDIGGPAGMVWNIIEIKEDMEAEGNVDASHPWLEADFIDSCVAAEMTVEMNSKDETGQSDRDDLEESVKYKGANRPASVFGPGGWYFKHKKFG